VILSIRAIVASAAFLASSSLYALSPVYTFQTGLGSDDVGDESDTFYYLTGAAGFSKAVSSKSVIDLQAEISTYEYSDNDDVSSDEIFLQGTYSITPWAGFRGPTFSASLRYLEEFASNDDFDASTITLILAASYRIDDRTRVMGGLKAGDRDSDTSLESNPTGYYINFDFLYSPQLTFYTSLGADEGAFTIRSYCSGAYNADAYQGGGYGSEWVPGEWVPGEWSPGGWSPGGWSPGEWTTNSSSDDCDNTYLTLGTNYSINSSNTLDFAVSYNDYDTPLGSLDGYIYTADYFYRF
jgi:hypothetical protein